MTPNREDYIKIIFEMNERSEKVTNKALAEHLGVSPASVSEMTRKLIEANLAVKDPKKGITLAQEGNSEAQNLIRKHRLWEVFLVEHLNYSWSTVHDDAEVLEHVTSDKLADRLSEFMGNPAYCPHGSIIYGNYKEGQQLQSLLSLKVGAKGVITKIVEDKALLEYIASLGLKLGQNFEVMAMDPYEGPVHLKVNNQMIALSYKAAQDIEIVMVEEEV